MSGTEPRTNRQSRVDWWRAQIQRRRMADLSVSRDEAEAAANARSRRRALRREKARALSPNR
jgi:hypothetical protein